MLLVAFGVVIGGSDGPGSLRCRHLGVGGSGSCLEGKMPLNKRARREERMRNNDGSVATVNDGWRRQHWHRPTMGRWGLVSCNVDEEETIFRVFIL